MANLPSATSPRATQVCATAGQCVSPADIDDADLQLSANPSITATGNIQAHLIPTVSSFLILCRSCPCSPIFQISFGINALDGLADVNVDLNVDASAQMSLSLSKSLNTAFAGCADISTGLSVNAVAGGDFFGLFNKSTKVSLYSHTWDLWKVRYASLTMISRSVVHHLLFF